MAGDIKTILVIADNHNQQLYSSLAFDLEKVEIVSFSQSIDFIRNSSIDIIVLDSGINPEKGLELLAGIKKHVSGVPILFLTDLRSYDTAVTAYKAGVRDYIKKPVSVRELSRIITDLLALKRKSAERREPLPCVVNNGACSGTASAYPDVPDYINRAVSYIEDNLHRINDLDNIADQVNLSTYHFSRNFKKYTGFSPMEFVRIMKMHRAKELLRIDNKSVALVAEEVGYIDLRSFERQFKQHTGNTPSGYRKSYHNS